MVVTLALGAYFADGFAKQGISIAGRFWPYASPQPRLALLQQGATTASLRRMATFT
jgi:hypothetical protein